MSRRHVAAKRIVLPDPKFKDAVVTKFMNCMMINGKKSASETVKLLAFNASMPDHQHGMVTKSNLSTVSPGIFRIDGIKFHMPGQWSINLKLEHNGKTEQVAIPLKL